jgi:hypothetical protein
MLPLPHSACQTLEADEGATNRVVRCLKGCAMSLFDGPMICVPPNGCKYRSTLGLLFNAEQEVVVSWEG